MPPILSPTESLKQAVQIAGSQSALARELGISQHAVWNWLDKGLDLPASHVLKVEELTGISRHDLRPDLYPRATVPGESDTAPDPDRRVTRAGEPA